ncbi:MAG: cache domain-containing protein [Haliea sp.]|nr:cache domain-containing protein [Haliea sp.]
MLKFRKTKKVPDDDNPRLAVANSPQGISAKGNALQKIGGIALSAVLIPLMLAFAYLILLRQPALQEQQVDRVSSSFALQQATNIHQLFAHMQDRIRSAALSPLALSAIASESEDDLSLVEKAMLDYFPEVASLRIIPIGDMGTADFSQGNQGLRNHIEVDLVRRTSEGEETQPEAYKFEDRWLTTVAAKVSHPRIEDRWAVIVVTMDNERIAKQLKPLGDSNGRFALEQLYVTPGGQDRLDIIAENGSGSVGPNTRYADVPGTPWRVSFSPSDTLMSTLSIDPMALYTVLALITLSAFAALSVVLILFPRKLKEEIEKIVVAADQKRRLISRFRSWCRSRNNCGAPPCAPCAKPAQARKRRRGRKRQCLTRGTQISPTRSFNPKICSMKMRMRMRFWNLIWRPATPQKPSLTAR